MSKFHYQCGPNPKSNRRKKVKQKHRYGSGHIDSDWIKSKTNGYGGGYHYIDREGLVRITFMSGKSRLLIGWYNLILYWKYLRRRMKCLSL